MRTGPHSRAGLELPNETYVRLDQRSTVVFPAAERDDQGLLLDLLDGIGYFFSRTPKRLQIKTPFVNAAVEGTEFLVSTLADERSRVAVFEGRVRATSPAGEVLLASGEEALALPGEPPRKRLIARPRDAVAWALYYPPVLDDQPGEMPEAIAGALERFYRNDISGALARLEGASRARPGVDLETLRAALLLYVGRLGEAQVALDSALALAPDDGEALALRAIVALVLDGPERAGRLARRAAAAAPRSAAPRIALSYVEQARFDLAQAREQARMATELAPGNALAWARLAELQLALGELARARDAAETATDLRPGLSRTQTVLGFARLLGFATEDAERHFAQAIELDQADPLPRLGLGIARIRRGDLAEGRRELEIAATLDPATALTRSYLGKAYFDEKRAQLAGTEYRIAKGLDPKDPTPWLYGAILAQVENRPVAALEQMRRSIALNDHRVVYRSRLALDSDLAARGAAQARIYTDLGFEDQALSTGWRAISDDPTSFAAHRYLADAYLGRPRYEVARVAELLQAKLWQPLAIDPIQPQLAQPGLVGVQSGGPSLAGLNEYHPLFARDGVRAQANLTLGGNGTLADDLAVSVVQGGLALGAGQYHFETDGFRPNADRSEDLYNLFVQFAPSARASLQAEYRRYDLEQGDTALRFDPARYPTDARYESSSSMLRLGGRYDLSPHSKMIASVMAEDQDFSLWELEDYSPHQFKTDAVMESRSVAAELQHVYARERFDLIGGLGYIHLTPEVTGDFIVTIPAMVIPNPSPPPDFITVPPSEFVTPIDSDAEIEARKAYLYANYAIDPALTLHVGASWNECRNPTREHSDVDHKVGLNWRITPRTELRAATFETVRCIGSDISTPALSLAQPESQTIEPTQVAGFNQLFDDAPGYGTTSDFIGVALEHRFNQRLTGGATVTRRDLRVPYLDVPLPPEPPSVEEAKWREDYARGFLNLAASEHWAGSLAYQYEMLDYTEELVPNGASRLTTHRVPLSLRFFADNGLSAAVTATHVDQAIDLYDTVTAQGASDRESFWYFDAALSYRLPKRRGLIRLGVRNLLDEAFRFQEPDARITTLYPERLFLATLSLSFD